MPFSLAYAEICRLSLADPEKLVTFAIDCMVLIAKITIEVLIAKSLQKKVAISLIGVWLSSYL